MQERYPEKRLHLKAVAWLREQRGYDERFSDEEAVGHRMDSVGLLDGRMTLIEVKPTVSAPLVTSIEHKIAGTLGPIYRGETGDLAERARSLWDRTTPPLVAILAGSYSEPALTGLHPLLERRSDDWLFGYEIMRWEGEQVVTVAQGGLHTPVPSETFTRLDVPRLTVKSNRPRARSLEELIEIADQRGVGELFRRFIENARARSYRLGTRRWTLNVKTRLRGYENGQFLGAYLDASGDGRLHVGVWAEALDLDGRELPGAPTAKTGGFLNTNRDLTSVEDVDRLFDLPLLGSDTIARADTPKLATKRTRARARSLDELIEIADQRGVGVLFRRFIENVRARSYTLGTARWTASVKTRLPGYENGQFLGAYLDASGDGRLNVGVWSEALNLDGRELPGVPAPKAGFLKTNRELSTIEEVDRLFHLPVRTVDGESEG